jgi:histone deacetylase 1/2
MTPDGRVYISKDVVFNELEFPYPSLCHSSSSFAMSTDTDSWFSLIPILPPSTPPSQPSGIEPLSSVLPTPTEVSDPDVELSSASGPILSSSNSSEHSPSVIACPAPPPRFTNDHPMVTRGKTGNLKPKNFLAHSVPHIVKQALDNPYWLQAMKVEYLDLMNNNTWSLVPLSAHKRAIGCKWVFRIKENLVGAINKYKARLVAKGFNQEQGFYFTLVIMACFSNLPLQLPSFLLESTVTLTGLMTWMTGALYQALAFSLVQILSLGVPRSKP